MHGMVIIERPLGAIAVMHVEINNRHALDPKALLCHSRRTGDVVEQAKSHGVIKHRMMPRRTQRTKGSLPLACQHLLNRQ